MINKIYTPIDILCRELNRLDNDNDRLHMLKILKSHFNNLHFNSRTIESVCSIFHDEKYRIEAIHQLIPFISDLITHEILKTLFDLFTSNEYRLNLMELLKNYEPLKVNRDLNEILMNVYCQYNSGKTSQTIENIHIDDHEHSQFTTSNVVQISSNTSGVFEKAKQFVCRVFGSSTTYLSDENLSIKRSLNDESVLLDDNQRTKVPKLNDDSQFQPTTIQLSETQSFTSVITKSPPPSPLTRQSSMSFHLDNSSITNQTTMVTQIHSILDNIDSVLDKIEAQTNSINYRSDFNDNYSQINTSNQIPIVSVQQGTNQITQTAVHFVNMNDGSGDTTPTFIDLLDIVEDSSSIISSDDSESINDNSH